MPQIDFSHLRTFLAKLPIKNEAKKVVPFRPNPAQHKFLDMLEDLQRKKRPPRIIVVKSRRVGISAICTGILTAHCVAVANADARIVAQLKDTANGLYSAARLMHAKLKRGFGHSWPEPTQHILTYGVGGEGSQLTTATAKNMSGGRGLGFSAILATEAAYYEQEGSFLSMLPTTPVFDDDGSVLHEFFVFIESTANGRDDVGETFYEQYDLAARGASDFTAFFTGPQDDLKCIADPEILKTSTDDENAREEKELVKRFGLTQPQLAWRRMKYNSAEVRQNLNLLHQEYPYWPEQAFVATGNPVFSDSELRLAEETVKQAGKPRRVNLNTQGAYLKNRRVVLGSGIGPYHIWKMPVRGHRYYIGVDSAKGTEDGDFAAMVCFDGNTGEQVAEFCERASVEEFADLVDRLGRFYTDGTMPALLNIEITGGYGNSVQQRLRDDYGYSNFARWRGKDDRLQVGGAMKAAIGWETTTRTRKMLMDHFRIDLKNGILKVASPVVFHQMGLATQEFGMRWEVRRGHDDALMAAMVSWIAVVQWPPPPMDLKRSVSTTNTAQKAEAQLPGERGYLDLQNISPVLTAHREKVLQPPRQQPLGFGVKGLSI